MNWVPKGQCLSSPFVLSIRNVFNPEAPGHSSALYLACFKTYLGGLEGSQVRSGIYIHQNKTLWQIDLSQQGQRISPLVLVVVQLL